MSTKKTNAGKGLETMGATPCGQSAMLCGNGATLCGGVRDAMRMQ